jgi:hypothetical protein
MASVALHRPVRQSKLRLEKLIGLASSLGSCELVTDSKAVRHLRCLIALPYAFP